MTFKGPFQAKQYILSFCDSPSWRISVTDAQWWLDRNNLSLSDQPWPSLSIQVEKGSEERNISLFHVLPLPCYKALFPPLYGLCKVGTCSTSTFHLEANSQGASDTIFCKWTLKRRKPLFLRSFKVLINNEASNLHKCTLPLDKPSLETAFAPSDDGQPFFQPCFTTPPRGSAIRGGLRACTFSIQASRQLLELQSQLVRRDSWHTSNDQSDFPGWVSKEGDILVTWSNSSQSQLHVHLIHNATRPLTLFPCCFQQWMKRKITDH